MPILHLGVIDQPYSFPAPGRRKRKKVAAGTQSTGDVAGWLENRYHIMESFLQLHGDDVIAPALADSVAGALESVLMGAPAGGDIWGTAVGKIEQAFRRMIDSKELDALGYPGIPTAASIKGIRRRFKRRIDPGRPSFQDTGLFEASFKAWVD